MRIVYFPHPGGVVNYPDDPSLFRNTRFYDGDIVGEYTGNDTSITSYIGPWPIVEISYKTLITLREFKSMFTPTEYRAISVTAGTDDILFQFWDIGQTTEPIDLEHPQTIAGMAHLVSVGLLTQARHDTIMQGMIV